MSSFRAHLPAHIIAVGQASPLICCCCRVLRYNSTYNPIDFENQIKLILKGKPPLPRECMSHPRRLVCKVDDA